MELERVRERLSKKWELERLRLHDAAAQTAQVRNANSRGFWMGWPGDDPGS